MLLWMLLPGWGIWARTRYRRLCGSGSVSEWAPRRTWKTLPSLEERQHVGCGGSAHPVGHTEQGVLLHPAMAMGCQRAPPTECHELPGVLQPLPNPHSRREQSPGAPALGSGLWSRIWPEASSYPQHGSAPTLTPPPHSRLLSAVRSAQHPLLGDEEAPADVLPVQLQRGHVRPQVGLGLVAPQDPSPGLPCCRQERGWVSWASPQPAQTERGAGLPRRFPPDIPGPLLVGHGSTWLQTEAGIGGSGGTPCAGDIAAPACPCPGVWGGALTIHHGP